MKKLRGEWQLKKNTELYRVKKGEMDEWKIE